MGDAGSGSNRDGPQNGSSIEEYRSVPSTPGPSWQLELQRCKRTRSRGTVVQSQNGKFFGSVLTSSSLLCPEPCPTPELADKGGACRDTVIFAKLVIKSQLGVT